MPWFLTVLFSLAVLVVALLVGSTDVYPLSALLSLWGEGGTLDEAERYILWEIRAPRVLAAYVSGGVLAIAGAVVQAVYRNPLAEPGLVGISGGAAAAAALSVSLVGAAVGLPLMQTMAFLGAFVSCLLVWKIGKHTVAYWQAPLLVGVALNALALAIIGVSIYLAPDNTFRAFSFWMLGSFANADWTSFIPLAGLTLVGAVLVLLSHDKLDRLLLGEDEAKTMGEDPQRVRLLMFVAISLSVGCVTALFGMIAFVGLLVPHWVRRLHGVLHAQLLPMCFLYGAGFTVLADLLARTVVAPAEIPLGTLTALLGAPFFIWILLREKNSVA